MGILVEFRCYPVHKLRYTLFTIYYRLMAAILDFQHTQTSNRILICHSVLPDQVNMGVAAIAVVISLLSCVEAEILVTEFTEPPS